MLENRRGPLVELVRRRHSLEGMLQHTALLHQREVTLERRRDYAQEFDQRVAEQARRRRPWVEHFFGGSKEQRSRVSLVDLVSDRVGRTQVGIESSIHL